MRQGGYVTLVGYMTSDPELRLTKAGTPVADLRVGTTPRVKDESTGEWRDGAPSYFTVTCWRRLADHARASLRKGDPVIVQGKFRTDSYEDRSGQVRTEVKITADTVGHDLNRGTANYMRPMRSQQDEGDDQRQVDPETGEVTSGAPPLMDEEAIERFGRELDEELDQTSLSSAVSSPAGAAEPVPVPEEDEEAEEAEEAEAPAPF